MFTNKKNYHSYIHTIISFKTSFIKEILGNSKMHAVYKHLKSFTVYIQNSIFLDTGKVKIFNTMSIPYPLPLRMHRLIFH